MYMGYIYRALYVDAHVSLDRTQAPKLTQAFEGHSLLTSDKPRNIAIRNRSSKTRVSLGLVTRFKPDNAYKPGNLRKPLNREALKAQCLSQCRSPAARQWGGLSELLSDIPGRRFCTAFKQPLIVK